MNRIVEIAEMLAQAEARDDGVDRSIERAKELVKKLSERHAFRPGDIVRWKPGLKSHTTPGLGEPMLVVAVLEAPLTDGPKDSGSPYFRQPLDLVGALIDQDGDLCLYHFDSRRFELYQPEN